MQAAALRCLHGCMSLDFFKFDSRPKFKGGPQASVTGFVGTVIMIAIFIAYASSATVRFLNTPPVTVVTRSPTDGQRINLLPTCFAVPHLNDHKYFSYNLQLVHIAANGTKTKEPIRIARSTTVHGRDKLCIADDATHGYLENFCALGVSCSYVQFHLWVCGAQDPSNPTMNATNCKTAAVEETLETNYVTVTYQTGVGTTQVNTAPKMRSSSLYTSVFAFNHTTRQPDLIRQFEVEEWTNLVPVDSTYSLEYLFPPGTQPNKPTLEVKMVMASYHLETTENHRTFPDLIAQWSAFFGVLSAGCTVIFGWYNQRKFYDRNPMWARIDSEFKLIPLDEEQARIAMQKRFSSALGGGGGAAALDAGVFANQQNPPSSNYIRESFGAMNQFG